MPTTLKEMISAAHAAVPKIGFEEAAELLGREDVVCIDVREGAEIATSGKIAGAIHLSRGTLEMRTAPDSDFRHESLHPDKIVLVYCGSGGRAALAGKTLLEFGYADVRNLGGFKMWVESGGAVDPPGDGNP